MPALDRDENIGHLYLPFASDVRGALISLHLAKQDVYIFEGIRSMERQAMLWAQGRTAPGNIVTRARPGYSWHEYGCAVDIVFGGPGRWSWSENFDVVEKIMRAKGFEALSFERPHFQMTYGLDIEDAFMLFKTGGLPAVWQRLDKLRGKK